MENKSELIATIILYVLAFCLVILAIFVGNLEIKFTVLALAISFTAIGLGVLQARKTHQSIKNYYHQTKMQLDRIEGKKRKKRK